MYVRTYVPTLLNTIHYTMHVISILYGIVFRMYDVHTYIISIFVELRTFELMPFCSYICTYIRTYVHKVM